MAPALFIAAMPAVSLDMYKLFSGDVSLYLSLALVSRLFLNTITCIGENRGVAVRRDGSSASRAPTTATHELVAQTELRNQRAIAVWAFLTDIGKQTSALPNHHK